MLKITWTEALSKTASVSAANNVKRPISLLVWSLDTGWGKP